MSTSILSRTISGAVDKRVVLSNDFMMRKITASVLSNWTTGKKLRIGLVLSVNGSASITSNPCLAVGMNSGTTASFGRDNTTHFVGVIYNQSTWPYQTTTPRSYGTNDSFFPCVKIGASSSISASSVDTNAASGINASPNTHRTAFFLDILKGSPNFTLQLAHAQYNAANIGYDITPATFIDGMTVPMSAGNGIIAWQSYYSGLKRTIAVNEATNGYLDSIDISWNKTTPLEVCEVAYVVL